MRKQQIKRHKTTTENHKQEKLPIDLTKEMKNENKTIWFYLENDKE